jgi:hypothetical protein
MFATFFKAYFIGWDQGEFLVKVYTSSKVFLKSREILYYLCDEGSACLWPNNALGLDPFFLVHTLGH